MFCLLKQPIQCNECPGSPNASTWTNMIGFLAIESHCNQILPTYNGRPPGGHHWSLKSWIPGIFCGIWSHLLRPLERRGQAIQWSGTGPHPSPLGHHSASNGCCLLCERWVWCSTSLTVIFRTMASWKTSSLVLATTSCPYSCAWPSSGQYFSHFFCK